MKFGLVIFSLLFVLLFVPVSTIAQGSNANATGAATTTDGPPAKGADGASTTKEKNANGKPIAGKDVKPAAPPAAKAKQDAPPPEPGRTFIELRYVVDGTMLQGNKERSFLHSGINHTGEVSLFRSMTLGSGPRFEALVIGRYTDNPRVDPERSSLQKSYVKLTGETYEGLLGDGLANYSRLTLNQNIKGLHLRKDLHPKLRAQAVVGYFTDRWGSLYRDYTVFRDVTLDCTAGLTLGFLPPGCIEDPPGSSLFAISPDNPGKPYSRLTGGARVEWKLTPTLWVAGNWSHGKDLPQSLPEARVFCDDALTGFRTVRFIRPGCLAGETVLPGANRAAIEAVNNDVASAESNFEWRRMGMTMRAEVAHSWTSGGQPPAGATFGNFVCSTLPPIVGGSILDSRCFAGQVNDYAVRVEVAQKWKKFRWRSDYARFSPDFFSASARQVRDLQDYYGRVDYDVNQKLAVTWSWRRSTDNMNGQRHFTNVVRAPEIRAGLRDLPFYKPLLLQIGYRQRTLETAGSPLAIERRGRTTYIPFISADVPVKAMRFGIDYEHRNDSDRVRHTNSSETDRYGFSFRGAWNWDGWDFSPELRWDLERLRKSAPNDPAFSPLDPLLLFPADFFDAFDSNRSMRAGFFLEAPKYILVEAFYREFNSVVLLPVLASAALDPLQRFFYLNPGFKRPNWRATLTYKIKNDDNRTLTLLYERSNNRFSVGDPFVPDTRSFRETTIGGTMMLRFGH